MILTGLARLGRDATVRHIASGEAVADISLAFNYGRKGADGKQPTQWIEASLWGKRAESLAQYLTKGSAVCVVLEQPHIETYETRDGRPGHKLAARVVDIEFAGNRSGGETAAPATSAPAAAKPVADPMADLIDDIPF